jgi:uncharacterized protein (TIGR02266 family)
MVEMDPEAGASPSERGQRRAFPRVPLRAKARMEFAEQRCFLSEWAVNLSPGGMFVRSEAPMAAGQRFEFEASLTPKGPRFEGVGEVMWVRADWEGNARPPGFAVRFIELEADGREMMIRLAEVFLDRGVGAMQEELQAMAAAWQRRRLDEESTDELEALAEPPLLPDTAVIEPPWAAGAADEAVTAKVEQAEIAAAADEMDATDAERTVEAPLAVEPAAEGEKPAAGAPAAPPGRRRVWWVGVLALLLGGSGYVVVRGPLAGLGAAQRVDGDAAASLPAPPPAARAAVPAGAPPIALPATFTGLEDVTWERDGDDRLWVELVLDGELPAGSLYQEPKQDPPRQLLRLVGARHDFPVTEKAVHLPQLERIRFAMHRADEGDAAAPAAVDELWVVLDLPSPAVVVGPTFAEGRSVRLLLTSAPAAPDAAAIAPPSPAAATAAAAVPRAPEAVANPSVTPQ